MGNDINTIVCQESGNWSASIVCVLGKRNFDFTTIMCNYQPFKKIRKINVSDYFF